MHILLVDGQFLYRQGLKKYLEEKETFSVVGETSCGTEALILADKLHPDTVIMDISIPDQYGLETTRLLKSSYPHLKIMVLSDSVDHGFVNQALKAGVTGYVTKKTAGEELMFALEALAKDCPYLSPAVMQPVINCFMRTEPEECALIDYNLLSKREKEVLGLLVKGQGRSTIAGTLHISPKTVDRHKSSIQNKLNLRGEAELQNFSALIGLI